MEGWEEGDGAEPIREGGTYSNYWTLNDHLNAAQNDSCNFDIYFTIQLTCDGL